MQKNQTSSKNKEKNFEQIKNDLKKKHRDINKKMKKIGITTCFEESKEEEPRPNKHKKKRCRKKRKKHKPVKAKEEEEKEEIYEEDFNEEDELIFKGDSSKKNIQTQPQIRIKNIRKSKKKKPKRRNKRKRMQKSCTLNLGLKPHL